jgi:hypothetical protein
MHYGCDSNVGNKMKVSHSQLVLELGLSNQPLQESYRRYSSWVTRSWFVSFWEKCEKFGIRVVINDNPIDFVRERDRWLMALFVSMGFTDRELEILNRVRIYQQVIFLSDIISVSGRSLDERYLRKRPAGEQWSTLKFSKEKPTRKDFNLWELALRQLVPAAGLPVRLGRFLRQGHKIWEWRFCEAQQCLFRYSEAGMSLYEPSSTTRRKWKQTDGGFTPEILGVPCMVRGGADQAVAITSVASPPDTVEMPDTLLEVLREWGNTWIWKSLRLVGDDGWLLDAIRAGTCIAVTDGSYI